MDSVYRLAGQDRTRLRAVPPLILRAFGVVNKAVGELVEMQYQTAEPFVVDSSKIATRLDVHATPLDRALQQTIDTYRAAPSPHRGHVRH